MPLPVAIGGVLAGLGTSVTALLKFADNPITSYFLVIGLLVIDAGIGFSLNYQGVAGYLFTLIINNLGVPIVIYSYQLAILFALLPLFIFSIKR